MQGFYLTSKGVPIQYSGATLTFSFKEVNSSWILYASTEETLLCDKSTVLN